jgi:hypothetical protein
MVRWKTAKLIGEYYALWIRNLWVIKRTTNEEKKEKEKK